MVIKENNTIKDEKWLQNQYRYKQREQYILYSRPPVSCYSNGTPLTSELILIPIGINGRGRGTFLTY